MAIFRFSGLVLMSLTLHLMLGCQPELKLKVNAAAIAVPETQETLIATGLYHSCAILEGESTLKCWGSHSSTTSPYPFLIPSPATPSSCDSSNLGVGSYCYNTAVEIEGLPTGVISKLVIAAMSTCVLIKGNVYCWGFDGTRTLGHETATHACTIANTERCDPTPTVVSFPGNVSIVDLASGGFHLCALDSSRQMYCWGWNGAGQLGYVSSDDDCTYMGGNPQCQSGPEQVPGVSGVEKMSLSIGSTCYLKSGAVKCFGSINDWATTSATPVSIHADFDSGVVDFNIGSEFYCARKSNGLIYCFGINNFGNLGDGTTTDNFNTTLGTSTSITSSLAGATFEITNFAVWGSINNICALLNGAVTCWGFNTAGNIGPTAGVDILTPTPLSDLASGVTQMAPGLLHSCFVKAGSVYCLGSNDVGALGNGGQASEAFSESIVPVTWPP